jgi:hypothetical protein
LSLFILRNQNQEYKDGKIPSLQEASWAKKKSSSPRLKYDLTQAGRRKLPEDFFYTQNHKSIWNSFSNFLDEKFAEEDLISEILDKDEVTRIKTAPAIPPMLQFQPQTPGEVESEESQRARARGQSLADKSYAGRETQYFDGIKKLAAKFSRATVLVLKHTDALINLEMHQFLKSDPVKRLDPETMYRRLRQYFSERWGPHSSLDVAKIKADLTSMQGDDPGWRKYLQNFNYFVGSLESTQQRDANDAIIYGPAPAAIYPARPSSTAPVAEHTAYIIACQQADDARDTQFPHGGPALNHKPTDAELKTILLDVLAASTLRAYQTLYQQYCNRSSTGKTYQDLYNDIHDLVKYDGDGIKSSTVKDSDMDESDGLRSTKEGSRSCHSHSSRRNQQIAAAANYLAQQQVASNSAANANIRYQEQSPGKSGGHSSSPGQGAQPPCKNCKSTKHTTKFCTSTKCFEPNCGKSFKDAAERKAHYVREHGFYKSDDKQTPAGRKSSLKKGQSKPGVKFSKVNRVPSEDGGEEDDDSCIDSEVSSDSSMSVDRPPKSLVWKDRPKSRKVSKIRTVSTIHRTTRLESPTEDTTNDAAPQPNVSDTEAAVNEEQAPPEPTSEPPPETSIPLEPEQPSVPARKKAIMKWPPRDGLPGHGMHRGRMYYTEYEDHVEHHAQPQPRRSFPVPKYKDHHSKTEQTSDSKLPGDTSDDKSPGEDTEQPGTGKMSQDPESPELPEPEYTFDFRPDTSSKGSNPNDHEPSRESSP